MIVLHKLNGDEFIINSNHIETIEERPDTVITLFNEKKYIVKESAEEIIDKSITYQKKIHEMKKDE
ncbi:MAG TPA: flagellar FlbD family protein [Spirochaetota bacterium]|nr:flagellar FlbD family protein [Spirochaetota bacterium]HPI88571.1 flagellar FlbD family protein [Spirochaetota bacterium]HPR48212.1 flagellar FlbD family protein [Spirochaetota bacterium]